MMLVGSIGAYMTDMDSASNVMSIGNNTIEIVENFQPPEGGYKGGEVIPKEVKVTNIESVPCYVRVYLESTYSDINHSGEPSYNESFEKSESSGLSSRDLRLDTTKYYFQMFKTSGGISSSLKDIPMDTVFDGWVHSSDDGWYYYTKPLGVGESTTSLIDNVCYSKKYSGWIDIEDIDVYVYSESVQDMGMRDEFDVDDFAGEEEYDVVSTMYTWYKYWGNAPKKTVLPEGVN